MRGLIWMAVRPVIVFVSETIGVYCHVYNRFYGHFLVTFAIFSGRFEWTL